MQSNTVSLKEIPLVVTVDDRKVNLDIANITAIQTAAGATLQLTGTFTDLGQINDLKTYLQSISPEVIAQAF